MIHIGQKRPGVDQSLVHWVSGGFPPTLFNGLDIRALQWGSVSLCSLVSLQGHMGFVTENFACLQHVIKTLGR